MDRALADRVSAAVRAGRADRAYLYGIEPHDNLTLDDLAAKPLVLDQDMRIALAKIGDHYGHEMLHLVEERDAAGCLTPSNLARMAGQADHWFVFADAMRNKRPLKHTGRRVEAHRLEPEVTR